ncbi:MAG: hypothetical protein Phog2KO_03170 [Phototrophicaceae bacterium]
MNIFQYQDKISKRLLRWSIGSIVVGLLMRFGGKFGKNLGNQFISWGLIDAAIAVGGQIAKRNRIDHMDNPGKPEIKREEAENLSRVLWVNAGLDVLYMIWGFMWAKRDKGDGVARGNGIGIIIQGLFLFVFDIFHARNMPKNHDK